MNDEWQEQLEDLEDLIADVEDQLDELLNESASPPLHAAADSLTKEGLFYEH